MVESRWFGEVNTEEGVGEFSTGENVLQIKFNKFEDFHTMELLLKLSYNLGYKDGLDNTKKSVMDKLNNLH